MASKAVLECCSLTALPQYIAHGNVDVVGPEAPANRVRIESNFALYQFIAFLQMLSFQNVASPFALWVLLIIDQ